ncbi:MAG: hypothetical protein HY791_26600 [Deltaproteobacteria bacterium]|nr:hypothetical protein [Deltaproteobacteria bacterium]
MSHPVEPSATPATACPGTILAFATVAPGQVEIEGLPAAARKRLPRYPLPVLRLARLAVDVSAESGGAPARTASASAWAIRKASTRDAVITHSSSSAWKHSALIR